HVVYLRNARATRLAEVLRGALGGTQGGSGSVAGDLLGGGLSDMPDGGGALSGPATNTFSTPAAARSGFEATGSGLGRQSGINPLQQGVAFTAGGATGQADPTTNTLLSSAPPPLYRNLREILDPRPAHRAPVLVGALTVAG